MLYVRTQTEESTPTVSGNSLFSLIHTTVNVDNDVQLSIGNRATAYSNIVVEPLMA